MKKENIIKKIVRKIHFQHYTIFIKKKKVCLWTTCIIGPYVVQGSVVFPRWERALLAIPPFNGITTSQQTRLTFVSSGNWLYSIKSLIPEWHFPLPLLSRILPACSTTQLKVSPHGAPITCKTMQPWMKSSNAICPRPCLSNLRMRMSWNWSESRYPWRGKWGWTEDQESGRSHQHLRPPSKRPHSLWHQLITNNKWPRLGWETRGANSSTCTLGTKPSFCNAPHLQSCEWLMWRPSHLPGGGECYPEASAVRRSRSLLWAHSFTSSILIPQCCTPKIIPQGTQLHCEVFILQKFHFTFERMYHWRLPNKQNVKSGK